MSRNNKTTIFKLLDTSLCVNGRKKKQDKIDITTSKTMKGSKTKKNR